MAKNSSIFDNKWFWAGAGVAVVLVTNLFGLKTKIFGALGIKL